MKLNTALKIFLFYSFTFSRLFAQSNLPFNLIKDKDYKFWIVGMPNKPCLDIIKTAQALRSWRQDKEGLKLNIARPKISEDKRCYQEITNLIPPFIRNFTLVSQASDGPNCWNSSLVMSGILPYLRYTHDNEFAFWMNSPLCKELKKDESKKPGDIVAIRSTRRDGESAGKIWKESHAFIYLTKDLSFSKNGFTVGNPYALQHTQAVIDLYRRIEGESNRDIRVDYFRCQTLENYFKSIGQKDINPELLKFDQRLQNFEKTLSDSALYGLSFDIEYFYNSLELIEEDLRTSYHSVKLSSYDDRLNLWKALKLRINGLRGQLHLIEMTVKSLEKQATSK